MPIPEPTSEDIPDKIKELVYVEHPNNKFESLMRNQTIEDMKANIYNK